jgi:acetone carboxylase gamma subunit
MLRKNAQIENYVQEIMRTTQKMREMSPKVRIDVPRWSEVLEYFQIDGDEL